MKQKEIVNIENVWVKKDDQIILEDINLTVLKGEIVSVVGPNGGGKTTLLNTIMGFQEPFRGKIRVFGKDPKSNLKMGTIGLLPQECNQDRHFPVSVSDVVAMSRYAKKKWGGKLTPEDTTLIHQALSDVHMHAFKDHYFRTLSAGQQQRVLIARALAVQPELLIMDEPSTGLDVVAQDTFYNLLLKFRDEKRMTIIIVSHDIGTVSTVVDRIACLNKKIHFHGKPEKCMSIEKLEKVFGKDVHILVHDEKCQTCEK